MRIAFVAPFGLGAKTTVWARTLPLAKELVALGHDTTILIPPWDTPADAGKGWSDEGVQIHNVALGGGMLGILWRMQRRLRLFQPDVVHIVKPRAHAGLIQWWLWQRRRLRGMLKLEQTPHILLDIDDWEQAWSEINQYGWLLSTFLRWQEEWGIRHADGISAASRWLVDRATEYASECPILYLPNGVSEPIPRPATSEHPNPTGIDDFESGPTILYFTRFIEVEPEWLAQFWNHLQALVPEVKLVIAGNALTPGREEVFRQALDNSALDGAMSNAKSCTGSGVSWLGYVPFEELPALYAAADCAIFPSAEKPLLQAKCSVRLATVLLHGIPVVGSAVGQQAEYGAGGAALLLPADATPQHFAGKVAELLAHPERQTQLGKQARKRLLAEFNWQGLGARLEKFYEQFVG